MNKYAEYKETYKAMIKEALFNDDKMSPEGLAATINATTAGGSLLNVMRKAYTTGTFNPKDPAHLIGALLLSGLGTGAYAGLGALTSNIGKRFDNPLLAYGTGLIGGPGGVAGVVRGRE